MPGLTGDLKTKIKVIICEGNNEAEFIKLLVGKDNVSLHNLSRERKKPLRKRQTNFFRNWKFISISRNKDILIKIEGGIEKVRYMIRILFEEGQIENVEEKENIEVIFICDNEKGNKTIKLIRRIFGKHIKRKRYNRFTLLSTIKFGVKIKFLISNPSLEHIIGIEYFLSGEEKAKKIARFLNNLPYKDKLKEFLLE